MTEHERVRAEYKAWRKNVMFADASDSFEAGWLAAKADTKRAEAEVAHVKHLADVMASPPLPTFDEWHKARTGAKYRTRGIGESIAQHMAILSYDLRQYVSEMVQRR